VMRCFLARGRPHPPPASRVRWRCVAVCCLFGCAPLQWPAHGATSVAQERPSLGGAELQSEQECLSDVAREPVTQIVVYDWRLPDEFVASLPPDVSAEHAFLYHQASELDACLRQGRRAYWVMQTLQLKLSRPGDTVGLHHTELDRRTWSKQPPAGFGAGTRTAICVPGTCQEHVVAGWFAHTALLLGQGLVADDDVPRAIIGAKSPALQRRVGWKLADLYPAKVRASLAVVLKSMYYLREVPASSWDDPGLEVAPFIEFLFVFEQQLRHQPSTWPLPALSLGTSQASVLSSSSRPVAVCYAGHWRLKPSLVESARRFLIEPLVADVYGVFSGGPRADRFRERARKGLAELLPSLVYLDFVEDISTQRLRKQIASSGMASFYELSGSTAVSPLTIGSSPCASIASRSTRWSVAEDTAESSSAALTTIGRRRIHHSTS